MEGGRDTTLSQIDPFPTTDDSDPGKNNYNVHCSHIVNTGGGLGCTSPVYTQLQTYR